MKNFKTLSILLTLCCFIFFHLESLSATPHEPYITFIGKENVIVSLEVARTPEEKNLGLMNRNFLADNKGMVFLFKPAQKVTFWMKDTFIPLDMIFIKNGKILKIVKNATPNQTNTLYPSDFAITHVVEVNGGFADKYNISAGNKVKFKNIN